MRYKDILDNDKDVQEVLYKGQETHTDGVELQGKVLEERIDEVMHKAGSCLHECL
mgnify:CR=1 FL=1